MLLLLSKIFEFLTKDKNNGRHGSEYMGGL